MITFLRTRTRIKLFFKKFRQYSRVPFKLDIHAVEHCNLNCAGCSHYSSLASEEYVDEVVLRESLQKLSKFEHWFGAVQLLGGEPLLNPRLPAIIRMTREYFKTVQINLLTNGILLTRPDRITEEFWSACRECDIVVRVTKYPVKQIDYDAIEAVCRRNNVKYEEFSDKSREKNGWTFFHLYENGSKYLAYKIKWLKLDKCDSHNCFQLVGNKIFPCSHSAYVRHLNKAFGTNFKHVEGDYIEVDKLHEPGQLRRMMLYAMPFCKYCGDGYFPAEWRVTKREPEEWLHTS